MRVFMTGGGGFVGRAVIDELLDGSHEVLGLVRSDAAADELRRPGVEATVGSFQDHGVLADGTRRADAVIHLAFKHDFAKFVEECEADRLAIDALGAARAGTHKPFLAPNGMAGIAPPGQVLTERDDVPADYKLPRASEQTALRFAGDGTDVRVMRLGQVHDTRLQGLVTPLVGIAKAAGFAAYVGDGGQRWAAVHRADAARLFRLVLEAGVPNTRHHGVGEQGVTMRAIAEAIGCALGVPARSIAADDAERHFGPMGLFVGANMPASADETKRVLGWEPTGPTLIDDLDHLTEEAA